MKDFILEYASKEKLVQAESIERVKRSDVEAFVRKCEDRWEYSIDARQSDAHPHIWFVTIIHSRWLSNRDLTIDQRVHDRSLSVREATFQDAVSSV